MSCALPRAWLSRVRSRRAAYDRDRLQCLGGSNMRRSFFVAAALALACGDPQPIDDPFASATITLGGTSLPDPSAGLDESTGGQPDTDSATSSPSPVTGTDDTGSGGGTAGDTPLLDGSSGPPAASCGNGVQEGDETCDLGDLGDQTCADFGFEGGTLSCFVNCQGVSTEACYICGNGTIEGEEDCEGAVPQGVACDDLGFDAGEVTCGADCFYDTSQCSTCGNAAAEGTENCDGADLAGATCASIGFEGGDLACGASCVFDFAGCTGSNLTCAEQVIGNTSPQTVNGSTAGEDDDFGQSCGSGGGPDWLMVFIAPSAGTYTFDAIGSTYDTVLSLHQDCDGLEIACNDDFAGNPTCGCCSCSEVTATLAAGEQILVAMSGYSGGSGAFTLNVSGP
jgi:hypothetical protein